MNVANIAPAADLALAEYRAAIALAETKYRAAGGGAIWPAVDDVPTVPNGNVRPIPWTQLVSEIEEMYKPPARAVATLRFMRRMLDVVGEIGNPETSADLTCGLVSKVIAAHSPGRSANTIRATLRALAVVCGYAEKTGRLHVSPFEIRPLKSWVRPSPALSEHYLGAAQVRSLLDLLARDVAERSGYACWRSRRLQAVVNLVCFAGLRKMEVLSLHVADLDIEGRIVRIVDRSAQGGNRLKTSHSGSIGVPLAHE